MTDQVEEEPQFPVATENLLAPDPLNRNIARKKAVNKSRSILNFFGCV
jgi:hypothetical protein